MTKDPICGMEVDEATALKPDRSIFAASIADKKFSEKLHSAIRRIRQLQTKDQRAVAADMSKRSRTFGGKRFGSVPTVLHRHEIFDGERGLVGNGILSRFDRVTLDAKAGMLVLE